jgi:hypothetical protein
VAPPSKRCPGSDGPTQLLDDLSPSVTIPVLAVGDRRRVGIRKAPGRGCVQVATVDAGGAGGDAGPVARSPGAFSVMAVGMLVVGWALWRIPWLPGTALIPPTSSTLHERPVLTLAEGSHVDA